MLWLNLAMALKASVGMWHMTLLFMFHWLKEANDLD